MNRVPPALRTERKAGIVMQLESTLTCPSCGHRSVETMPTDACLFFYDCKGCRMRLKPLAGDCCVFCSYGSVPCPPVQSNDSCCVPRSAQAGGAGPKPVGVPQA